MLKKDVLVVTAKESSGVIIPSAEAARRGASSRSRRRCRRRRALRPSAEARRGASGVGCEEEDLCGKMREREGGGRGNE